VKVLVIDDETIVRRALGRALESKKHKVSLADEGRVGLELWRTFDPDVVFLDILMPGLSGLQVLKEVGESRRAKVILMSAYTGIHAENDLINLGADLFLKKPFDDIFEVLRLAEELFNETSTC
jgi:two-component system, response regulator PdtaR